jgi:queuine tRNA-ribosyltransferase
VTKAEPVFSVLCNSGTARRGVLRTAHGEVQTPTFMPVGTHGSVKACDPSEVLASGAQMILANFYHLSLRPGIDLIEELGGIHSFMSWPNSVLTDSGGYQLFSLGHIAAFDDEGATFRSPYDGRTIQLTPERVVADQVRLGVDVAMVLDHPVGFGLSDELTADATRRTHLWAQRCRTVATGETLLFGIVQGGFAAGTRRESAALIGDLKFDGVAIGGLVLGEPAPVRYAAIEACVDCLPASLPRYLMGLGSDMEILVAISQGVDMFDCVLPTRLARTGTVLTRRGRLALRRSGYRKDPRPLEEGCSCPACQGFSRAYLRHLYLAGEILAHRLLSLHNLRHLGELMAEARRAVEAGDIDQLIRDRAMLLSPGAVSEAPPTSITEPRGAVP